MIVHCETCNTDLLETESDRVAPDTKDGHEFEHLHPVNVYIEHWGGQIPICGDIWTIRRGHLGPSGTRQG